MSVRRKRIAGWVAAVILMLLGAVIINDVMLALPQAWPALIRGGIRVLLGMSVGVFIALATDPLRRAV